MIRISLSTAPPLVNEVEHTNNNIVDYDGRIIKYKQLVNDTNDDVPHDVPQGDLAIIVELIRKNPKITREEMAIAINKTTKTVQRIINKCEYIEYVGSGDKGHWGIM